MPSEIRFPYTSKDSAIFGTVLRPLISLEIKSIEDEWILIDEVLADSGADISVLPRYIGEMLVDEITNGEYMEIHGVVPSAVLIAFIHQLRIKIGNSELELPIAIADSNNVPCIFGRAKGLDEFDAEFNKGKEIILKK